MVVVLVEDEMTRGRVIEFAIAFNCSQFCITVKASLKERVEGKENMDPVLQKLLSSPYKISNSSKNWLRV